MTSPLHQKVMSDDGNGQSRKDEANQFT